MSNGSGNSNCSENSNTFTVYQPIVRMKSIGENSTDDRFKSLEMSKRNFWKASFSMKNVENMQCMISREGVITIHVIQSDAVNWRERNDFILMFCEEDGMKVMKLMSSSYLLLIRTELSSTGNIVHHAAKYFEKLLGFYQRDIKSLRLNGDVLEMIDFRGVSFNSLETLEVIGNVDIFPCVSKTAKILKKLVIKEGNHMYLFRKWMNVYKIRDTLIAPNLKLDRSQFLKLMAPYVYIHVEQLSISDIRHFVNLWKNGKLRKTIQARVWNLKDTQFDVINLLVGFGLSMDQAVHMARKKEIENPRIFSMNEDEFISIEQRLGTGVATISCTKKTLKFIVKTT